MAAAKSSKKQSIGQVPWAEGGGARRMIGGGRDETKERRVRKDDNVLLFFSAQPKQLSYHCNPEQECAVSTDASF